MSLDPTTLIGAGATVVGAVIWIGSLKQRVATLEAKQAEEASKSERDRGAAAAREADAAMYRQRLTTAETQLAEQRVRADTLARDLAEMRVAQTQLSAEHEASREVLAGLRGDMRDVNRKLDRLLGLSGGDTPPHGFVANPRD